MNIKDQLKVIAMVFLILTYCLLPSSLCLAAGTRLYVIATLFPLQEMACAVGGDRARVDLLLPPGAEPHSWDPRPSDMLKMAKANIFIYLGAGLEHWVPSLLEGVDNTALRVVRVSDGLPVVDSMQPGVDKEKVHDHTRLDPHLWLDFSYDQIMVASIAKAFSEQDPEGSDFYHQNALKYQKKLTALDQKYKEGLKNCQHRKIFLGGHSAFAYLARRYQLEQIPIYGISPDAEPSPKRLAVITDLAKKQHIKAIYFEELVSDRMAKVLAKEVGAKVLMLNPGANLTQEHLKSGVSFLSLMEQNLKSLQKGLVCE